MEGKFYPPHEEDDVDITLEIVGTRLMHARILLTQVPPSLLRDQIKEDHSHLCDELANLRVTETSYEQEIYRLSFVTRMVHRRLTDLVEHTSPLISSKTTIGPTEQTSIAEKPSPPAAAKALIDFWVPMDKRSVIKSQMDEEFEVALLEHHLRFANARYWKDTAAHFLPFIGRSVQNLLKLFGAVKLADIMHLFARH